MLQIRSQPTTGITHHCLVAKSHPTLCDPMDCCLLGSSVHGIFQARILEWVAISSARGSFQVRDQTCVSCIGRWILYCLATREAMIPSNHFQPVSLPSWRPRRGETAKSILALYCLYCWPMEAMHITKWLFYIAKPSIVYYLAIVKERDFDMWKWKAVNQKTCDNCLGTEGWKESGRDRMTLTRLRILLGRASTIEEQCYWKREETELLWWQRACYGAITKRIPWRFLAYFGPL